MTPISEAFSNNGGGGDPYIGEGRKRKTLENGGKPGPNSLSSWQQTKRVS